MSRLQILWQIGMLRLWFQSGYINPPPPPTAASSTPEKGKKRNQQQPFKMLSNEITACPRSAQDTSSPSSAHLGRSWGSCRRRSDDVSQFTFKSVHICLQNRSDKKNMSVYSWKPAMKAARRRRKRLWRRRFEVGLIHRGTFSHGRCHNLSSIWRRWEEQVCFLLWQEHTCIV